jgi:radical SAM superfamily enzyme YgiQ (UPF0313 family)
MNIDEHGANAMHILLIYPEFPDTFWSFRYALKFVRKRSISPPLGLLTIAAMLPADWPKRLIDLNVRALTDQDLAWADTVFISGMTVQQRSAREVLDCCHAAGVKIVAGGPLFTLQPELYEDVVDHFVLNEGELTLPQFLIDLERGCPQPVYTSTDYADIQQTPIPAWELLDFKRYAMASIQFSRGCPFNCDFCNVTALLGHRPRTKTVAQIMAELDRIYSLGWHSSILFVDDNFIGNKRQLKTELLPALIAWRQDKPGITFQTEASINMADDEELLQLMRAAGFTVVFIGIETPAESGLAECSKKQNLKRDLVADVKRIQRYGMQVQAGFIVGFDSDTPSIFQQQIDFIQRSGIVTAMVGLLQAPPGTGLYERLQGEGRLIAQSSGDNVDGTTNIIPAMNLEVLRAGYHHILQHIYAPRQYYQRVKTFLREYQPPHVMHAAPNSQQLLAWFRSIYRLGLIGKERAQYWNLFFWTLLHRPKLITLAVTLAIYGYHFRTVCELHGELHA